MPNMTFTLSAGSLTELTDALCALYNYQTLIDGLPNPETRQQFCKRMVILDMKKKVQDYRNSQAILAAQAGVTVVDPDIT